MKKTFLLLAAMCCLGMNSWADCICFGDSLPSDKYGGGARTIRDIWYNDRDSTISFNDTYEPSLTAYRRTYSVYFYEWQEGYQFYRNATGGDGAVDYFGASCGSNTRISIASATSEVNNCAGGWQTVDISYQVAELKKMGYTRVMAAICPSFQLSSTSNEFFYSKAEYYYELLNTLVMDIEPIEYGLSILGEKVTSNNYRDFFHDGGSVVYDPKTKVLTLDSATLSATTSEAITINDSITLVCDGINNIESQGNYAAIAQYKGKLDIQGSQLNVKSQNGAGIYAQNDVDIFSLSITVQSTNSYALQFINKGLTVRHARLTAKGNNTTATTIGICSFAKEGCDIVTSGVTFSAAKTGFEKSGSLTKGDVEIRYNIYDIYVQGVPVTNINYNDVLSNGGKVKYNDDTKTLTLNNATISATSGYGIEFPWMHNFTLELKGTNTINTTGGDGIYSTCEKLTIQGTGSLNVVSSKWSAIKAYGSAYKDKYALTIQGGCTLNLKGGSNGIFTFGSLHINRSTVVMQGNDASCQCKNGLYMTDADICNAGYYFSEEKIRNKNNQVATDEVTIGDKKMGIYIKGTQVTSFIAKDILKDGGTVSYNDATKTLTLNCATIKGSCSAGLAAYQDLIIYLIGENTIYNTSTTGGVGYVNDIGRTYIKSTGKNDVLNVQSDGGDGIELQEGALTIGDNCKVIAEGKKGSAVIVVDEGLYIYGGSLIAKGNKTNATIVSPVDFYVKGGIISRHTYDAVSHKFLNKDGNEATDNITISCISSVSIKDEWITANNRIDILGDKTAKYDFSTKTLTLNNANIQYADNDVIGAWQDLTIECVGNNTIQNIGNNYGIYQDGGSLSFTGNGNITIKAEKDAAIYSDYDVAITGGCTMTTQCADGFALTLTGEPLTIDGATLIARGNGKDATINGCTDLILKNGATIRSAHTYDATSHKFYVKGTTNEAKDDIIIGIDDPTGIEEVTGDRLQVTGSRKVLRDGQLIIIREGKIYNAQGARL